MAVVTGISDHYGRAECVTLSSRAGAPAILDRRSVRLIEPGLPSAPYHHEGLTLPLEEAEPIILRTRDSVVSHCRAALADLKSSLEVTAIVIQESPYEELPESVSQVLASRPLTYAADGMLYRESLVSQAAAIGLEVHRFPRKSDPIADAAQVLQCPESRIASILTDFAKTVGPPWRKEHKQVAAAVLCVLGSGTAPLR